MRHIDLKRVTNATPLPSRGDMREAMTTKQLRQMRPAGKRHGKRQFAKALSAYSGVVRCMRLDLRDLSRARQGDETEVRKTEAVRVVRDVWKTVA